MKAGHIAHEARAGVCCRRHAPPSMVARSLAARAVTASLTSYFTVGAKGLELLTSAV